MRHFTLYLLILTANCATAQWNPDTLDRNQLSTINVNVNPTILHDGQNGYFVGWVSGSLAGPGSYSMQRLTANGDTLWQRYGKTMIPTAAFDYADASKRSMTAGANSDGYIAWSNTAAFSNARIFVQRFNQDGDTLFGPNGLSLSPTPATSSIQFVRTLPDDSGGVIILYRVLYFSAQPFLGIERVDSSGNILIPPQTRIGPSGARYLWEVAADGNGGGFCLYESTTSASLLHFDRQGIATWASPMTVNVVCLDDTSQDMVKDPVSNGCFLLSLNSDYDLHLQYFDTAGTARWPGDGIAAAPPDMGGTHALLAPDYAGGTWVGYSLRYPTATDSLFYIVKHFDAGGNMVSGTDTTVIHMPSAAFHFAMAPDRSGGVYVSWQEYRYGRICVFGQHFDASGQRLWRADGYPVITSNNQYTSTPCTGGSCDDLDIVIADAGASGFVAAWGDNRTGPHTWGTYAAKADGLLPTSINAPSAGKLSASLAPVPAHNLLQVQIAEIFAQQDICYSIYDLRGACVQETRKLDTKQSMIDVSRLSSGFYLLHLSSGDRDIMLRWMKF